jgi:hypothetical protein
LVFETLNSVLLRSRRRCEFPRLQLRKDLVRGSISVLAGLAIWEILRPPFTFRAAKDNFRKLANFHEYLGPILFTTDFAHANYLKSHRGNSIIEEALKQLGK